MAYSRFSSIPTPVLKDGFSYNATVFLSKVLPRDAADLKSWFVLINGYDKRFEEAKSGRQIDFIEHFRKEEFPLTPTETWLPWTVQIRLLVDFNKKLTGTKGIPGVVYNADLYKAISELAGCFFDEELDIPEVF